VTETRPSDDAPDLGDIVVLLLAGTLAGLRDRLFSDGFGRAAEVVAELVDVADRYLTEVVPENGHRGGGLRPI
jgi:hypothetical protein